MRREIGCALRRELREIHVDEDLKRRILDAAAQSHSQRQPRYGLRALGLAAALALMIGAAALGLSMQSVKPDMRQSSVLSHGISAKSDADIADRVWRNPEDIYYHSRADCPVYVGGEELVPLAQAIEEGKRACPICMEQNEETAEIPSEPMREASPRIDETAGAEDTADLEIEARAYAAETGWLLMLVKDYDYELSLYESLEDTNTSWCNFSRLDVLANELSAVDFSRWSEAWSENPNITASQSLIETQVRIFADNREAAHDDAAAIDLEEPAGYCFNDPCEPGKSIILFELPEPCVDEELPVELRALRRYWKYDGVDIFEWRQEAECGIEEIGPGAYSVELCLENNGEVRAEAALSEAATTVNVPVRQSGNADAAWISLEAGSGKAGLWICRMEGGYAFVLFLAPWNDMEKASLELRTIEGKPLSPDGILDEKSMTDAIGAIYLERTDWDDACELVISIEEGDSIHVAMEEIESALETEELAEAQID